MAEDIPKDPLTGHADARTVPTTTVTSLSSVLRTTGQHAFGVVNRSLTSLSQNRNNKLPIEPQVQPVHQKDSLAHQ